MMLVFGSCISVQHILVEMLSLVTLLELLKNYLLVSEISTCKNKEYEKQNPLYGCVKSNPHKRYVIKK